MTEIFFGSQTCHSKLAFASEQFLCYNIHIIRMKARSAELAGPKDKLRSIRG